VLGEKLLGQSQKPKDFAPKEKLPDQITGTGNSMFTTGRSIVWHVVENVKKQRSYGEIGKDFRQNWQCIIVLGN